MVGVWVCKDKGGRVSWDRRGATPIHRPDRDSCGARDTHITLHDRTQESTGVTHLTAGQNTDYIMETTDGDEHTLEVVSEEKDLGITIDNNLKFSKHVVNQVNKANRILGAIRHTFATIDRYNFLPLYKSIVRPHLEYATVIWSPKLKRDRDALEQVQRRATRLVNGLSHLSYPERLQSLNLPTLEFRRQRNDVIETFKILNNFDKVDYQRQCGNCGNSLFKTSLGRTTRGHCKKTSSPAPDGA